MLFHSARQGVFVCGYKYLAGESQHALHTSMGSKTLRVGIDQIEYFSGKTFIVDNSRPHWTCNLLEYEIVSHAVDWSRYGDKHDRWSRILRNEAPQLDQVLFCRED